MQIRKVDVTLIAKSANHAEKDSLFFSDIFIYY